MKHFFLSSVIVGTSPLISNIAIATSWFSSVNVSSTSSTENFVCTKVNPKVSEVCQQPTILLDSNGKLDIQSHLFNQMTNLLIPQWNVVGQEVRVMAKHSKIITFALKQNENPLPPSSSNSSKDITTGSYSKKSAKSTKINPKNRNFPKVSRSSLLASSLKQNNYCSSTKSDNCYSLPKLNFSHPAPDTERVASPFGWRRRPYSGQYQFHQGIDYGAPLGSSVVAATDGIVTKVVSGCLDFRNRWCGNQFGNWIEIDHGNGASAIYGHLLHKSIAVKEGMKVWKNQEIAQVGSSGWSTGAHLDFRVKVNGKYQNPASLVQ